MLLGAFSFGVAIERGLPRCCDSPLIFDFLVFLGALVFLVLLGALVFSSPSSSIALARATLVVASEKGSATPNVY